MGEEEAAALVAIGCDRVGLDCAVLKVRELGIVADGPAEDAAPVRLGSDALAKALERHRVVIAPGYGAVDAEGRVVLLGRGGTDLTAVFLAAELGLTSVRLVKDVDGVYDGDPARPGRAGAPLRHARLGDGAQVWPASWCRCARSRRRRSAASPSRSPRSAWMRPAASALQAPARPGERPRRLKVALAGCGVVGGGVLERLLADSDHYEVVGVLVRDPAKPRDPQPAREILTADAEALLDLGADLLVEALSEGRPPSG